MNDSPAFIERAEAARILRSVRSAPPDRRDEAIEWAFSIFPQSRPLLRLRIRQLLDGNDPEDAAALIAQGLLKRPMDPALTLLRAECLMAQGRLEASRSELKLALKQRTKHLATLLLAATVAHRLADVPHETALLERALQLRPGDEQIKARLVNALIQADSPARARAVHQSMVAPPPIVTAGLRRCQRRWLDAVSVLQQAIDSETDPARQDELLEALIDVLEEMGDASALRPVLEQAGPELPRAQLRAGRAELSLGDFAASANRARRLTRRPRFRREALQLLVVAAAETGRLQMARDALCELKATDKTPDPRRMAEYWLRAFKGRMLRRQCNAARAGADPSLKILPALLSEAIAVFDEQLADDRGSLTGAERAVLEKHRVICLAALDRKREASAALARGVAA